MKKKKKKVEEEVKKAGGAEQNGKKRERKVYDLPGQKRDPPEEVICSFLWFDLCWKWFF